MDYRQFQRQLAAEVQNRAPREIDVRFRTITKNNGSHHRAMELRDAGTKLVPSIYTEQYYDAYQRGVPLAHLANLVLEQATQYGRMPDVAEQFFRSYEQSATQLYCKLINYEKNKAQLAHLPHERWLDLAVVVYYQVDPALLDDASILVKTEHLERWQVDAQTLLKDAWQNTIKRQPAVFQSVGSALEEMTDRTGTFKREEEALFLLTNREKCFGAVCICYPGLSWQIAKRLGGDYYLIPSSIHECLILRAERFYPLQQLAAMVREINRTQLAPSEVLSDCIYRYDSRRRVLRIA